MSTKRCTLRPAVGALAVLAMTALPGVAFAQAGPTGVTFTFTQSGGNVLMQSSGSLNTANLIAGTLGGWGGVGVEHNVPQESDIMGDTTVGSLTNAFGFHAGTDLTPWIGNMFTTSVNPWTVLTGTTQFTTYIFPGGVRTPGIAIGSEDLVGSVWTPNESWSHTGTIASLGLTPGTYKITDAVTREFITIQIGAGAVSGPEPGTIALLAVGLVGGAVIRRRK